MRTHKENGSLSLECTTFAVGGRRTAGSAVLFGQNVDLVPFLQEFGIVVVHRSSNQPRIDPDEHR